MTDELVQKVQLNLRSMNQIYRIQILYKEMQGEMRKPPWAYSVWNKLLVLKHCFISWLACREKQITNKGEAFQTHMWNAN